MSSTGRTSTTSSNEFAISQLRDIDTLLFGRATYEMMAAYWPSAEADDNDPMVVGYMNSIPKIVFSTTLERAELEQHHAGHRRRC